MKLCPACGQSVAEEIATCPSCGGLIGEGRRAIDDYRIVDVLHEGHSTFLCRAVRERTDEHVMIRLFTPKSGVDEEIAARLQRELEELKKLPGEGFVRHHAIRRSREGLWYRISEWVESESWGSLLAAGRLADRRLLLDLFYQMAAALSVLHAHNHFIPHLILNDLIAVSADGAGLKVKIDYKLSRFIDPKLDRPAPMLKKLLSIHPDIVNSRPLDFRSDIWSLGKVFVELLAGDFDVENPLARVEELELHDELAVLLRVMLADDPDLRPQSMEEVAASLSRIRPAAERTAPARAPGADAALPPRYFKKLQRRLRLLAAVVGVLIAAALAVWFTLGRPQPDTEGSLEGYANRYARSVGFVLVDYWLTADGKRIFRNVSEGTAFLVDPAGYMLTSRHVVCPWLEDPNFSGTVQYMRSQNAPLDFNYRLYLWFEGARAFNPAGRLIEGADLSDVYVIENAYSTESAPKVEISGVAKPPVRTRQLFTSPLKDDFAVLKLETVPNGVEPIPLDRAMDPRKLPKLTRVIALGFPLGSRTQADTVNASVVRGNVRRVFENMFQIDASLHGGNSGGPVIDGSGKVIGIVSAVAMDFTQGLVPMVTPVWDIGLILPITGAVQLLAELKAGQAKWNGVIDFSMEAALGKIREAAFQGRWAEALAEADRRLGRNPQPAMVTAAGMLHYCSGDFVGARRRFNQSLYMDAEDNQARFMLVLIDRLSGGRGDGIHEQELAAADWRSPAEFQGYLLQVLDGQVALDTALDGWTSAAERSWLLYIGGLMRMREGLLEDAQALLEQAVLAADPDSWEFYLARAKLDELRTQRRSALPSPARRNAYAAQTEQFEQALAGRLEQKKGRQEEIAPLIARLAEGTLTPEDKLQALRQLLQIDASNRNLLASLAFACAAAEKFPGALNYLRDYLKTQSRPNAMRMSLGLLEAGILHFQGREEEARARLADYGIGTVDPWFLSVAEYLLGRQTEEALRRQAAEAPERIVTGYALAGFWAEGSKDKTAAMRFYRDALASFLDNWVEYDFVRDRIRQLKRSE